MSWPMRQTKIDLVEFLSHHLEGVARAEFTLVLHTKLGEAAVLANVVDSIKTVGY